MSLSNHSGINFRRLVYLVDVGDHDQAGPDPAFHEQVAGQSQQTAAAVRRAALPTFRCALNNAL
jgi:hypothetical protein